MDAHYFSEGFFFDVAVFVGLLERRIEFEAPCVVYRIGFWHNCQDNANDP